MSVSIFAGLGSFGDFCSWLRNFSACTYVVAFLALSACPTLRPSPEVAGFVSFG